MRNYLNFLILVFAFFISAAELRSQNPDSVLLNKFYSGTLPEVLNDISREHHIRFDYDTAVCSKIYVAGHPENTPATVYLQGICRKNELAFYITNDQVVHIKAKSKSVPANIRTSVATKRDTSIRPTRYNFFLAGVVRDQSSGEALPFAIVSIKGTAVGVTANSDGYFTLPKVPTDTSTLVAQYLGYTKKEIYLTPDLAKQSVIFEMVPFSGEMKTVVITEEREDLLQVNNRAVSTIKMNPKSLEQLPNVGEKDIFRSLQLMPGISAANESSSGLYIRGGTPDQNLVLYDGFTVYHVDHLFGFFSAFNSYAIKDVQLYKGGYESRFGGRLSSVTEITGKDGNQRFNIGGDLSLLSMNVYAEVPVGDKFTSIVAFRRSWKSFLYTKISDKINSGSTTMAQGGGGPGGPGGADFNTQAKSFFYDLNAKFSYRPTSKDIISLSFFNGTDKIDNGFENSGLGGNESNSMSVTDLTNYGNLGSSLRWSRNWNTKLYSMAHLSYSYYYSTRDRTNEGSFTNGSGETTTFKMGTLENNYLNDLSLKYDIGWSPVSGHKIQAGVFATYYDIKYRFSQNDTSDILNRHTTGTLAGAYLQDEMSFFKGKMTVTPGMRFNYFDPTGKVYIEPRAAATVSLSKKLVLKAATGKYYQFANRVVREDILSGSKDFWVLSDGVRIPVSFAWHYILGLSYENEKYLFSAEAYYKDIHGLTEYSMRFRPSREGINYEENFYTGVGFARGIEFLAQRKYGNFKGWVSYTIGEAMNQFDVYSNQYYYADQDVTHEFKLVGLYKYKRWEFSATWIYATGRPYTAPSGAYSVELLDGTTQDYFTVTSKNSLRLPDYHRLDMAINYRLRNITRNEIGYIGFSVFNVYNRTNVWYKQFSITDGTITETNVNYLGITPNVTLSLKIR